ncbi:hypothetical protein AK812_SmicGene32226 [Symbiodinium microadriaticum]|uniref:Protein kinase domain-containing protein n=1 Tax=Symbiodinium microadriaticum TaxID=2951 RepID=A0A1Q9CUR7_SYMMI|nr:hypothetical protein AK812_SmicGene32226 [Symbiodinium microadriaticum]
MSLPSRFDIDPSQMLGAGSFGTVFKRLDTVTKRPVAVKVMEEELRHPAILQAVAVDGTFGIWAAPDGLHLPSMLGSSDVCASSAWVNGGRIRHLAYAASVGVQHFLHFHLQASPTMRVQEARQQATANREKVDKLEDEAGEAKLHYCVGAARRDANSEQQKVDRFVDALMDLEESALEQFLRGQSLPGEKNGKVGKVLAEFLDAPAALRQQVVDQLPIYKYVANRLTCRLSTAGVADGDAAEMRVESVDYGNGDGDIKKGQRKPKTKKKAGSALAAKAIRSV